VPPGIGFGMTGVDAPPYAELVGDIRCAECGREVDEFTAIAEKWGYWSDGIGELVPFCPECATREFAPRRSHNGERLPSGTRQRENGLSTARRARFGCVPDLDGGYGRSSEPMIVGT
jgi:hypothetical protein